MWLQSSYPGIYPANRDAHDDEKALQRYIRLRGAASLYVLYVSRIDKAH